MNTHLRSVIGFQSLSRGTLKDGGLAQISFLLAKEHGQKLSNERVMMFYHLGLFFSRYNAQCRSSLGVFYSVHMKRSVTFPGSAFYRAKHCTNQFQRVPFQLPNRFDTVVL